LSDGFQLEIGVSTGLDAGEVSLLTNDLTMLFKVNGFFGD